MDPKIADLFSRLMLEDDEDDVVFFAFPNQKKKIRCSISMLTDISPVFGAMFSDRWSQEKSGSVDITELNSVAPVSQNGQKDKTVQLSDEVSFDEYVTFKLLMQILYGLRQIDSLTVDQATNVYYFAHKYQIKDVEEQIQKFLNERMESGMSNVPLSVTELTESIEFAHIYCLDEFKKKLDLVKLAFDEENLNPMQFWNLAKKYEMKTLQQQIIEHVVTVAPTEDWPLDLLIAVTGCLQALREATKKAIENVQCRCRNGCKLYCGSCGFTDTLSSYYKTSLNKSL